MMGEIVSLSPEQAESDLKQLADLLIDAVASGASVGLMPPVGEAQALAYWRGVVAAVREGRRILLAAVDGDLI